MKDKDDEFNALITINKLGTRHGKTIAEQYNKQPSAKPNGGLDTNSMRYTNLPRSENEMIRKRYIRDETWKREHAQRTEMKFPILSFWF